MINRIHFFGVLFPTVRYCRKASRNVQSSRTRIQPDRWVRDQPSGRPDPRCAESDDPQPRISTARRRHLASGLRRICRLLELDPDTTTIGELLARSEQIRRFSPAKANLTPSSWRTLVSSVRAALRRVGVEIIPARSLTDFTPAWRDLLAEVPDKYHRFRLGRFGRWCTTERLEPDQVDQAAFVRFKEAAVHMPRAAASALVTAQEMARCWNKYADRLPGWPKVRLDPGTRSKRWTLPLESFSDSLQGEIDSYLASASGADLFAEDGPRRPYRPRTLDTRRYMMRAYVSALVVEGVDPAELRTLADLVEVKRVKLALSYLHGRSRRAHPGACTTTRA